LELTRKATAIDVKINRSAEILAVAFFDCEHASGAIFARQAAKNILLSRWLWN
jgi:hypothetical protein